MKRILPEADFTPEQLNTVRRLASDCNLCEETVKILYGRGFVTKEEILNFINPSKSKFISPFKMGGMREATELITQARDEGWSVVVYGDYDADGICASSVLYKALKEFGVDAQVFVPERSNGYGLGTELIDNIFEEYFPQLFITVDCGISCAEQVEYIKEMGAEVIVTDHHELPEKIPDCICINPKFNDGYIYDNLCGAGVAFKLACALIGENAYKYLDFVTIATVADSVPLTGENRDIVFEGLKLMNKSPDKRYSGFLGKNDGGITSQTIAYSIAPKINAAGRMNDARAALTLFTSDDDKQIYDLTVKLTEYNIERQKCCDALYASAKQMLADRGRIGKVIMLCNEEWNTGFVGIVAARLVEEYCRPVVLFVKKGEIFKGSARSVERVNIFEALKACSEYITEFGGHSQAAGVSVTEENFSLLEKALDDYISNNYTDEDFIPSLFVNDAPAPSSALRFSKELEKLEPFGVGNKRPLFVATEKALTVRPIKETHLAVSGNGLDYMYFGGLKYARLFESRVKKSLVYDIAYSEYRGKEQVKGYIREVVYNNETLGEADDEIAVAAVGLLAARANGAEIEEIDEKGVEKIISEDCGFGTAYICCNRQVLKEFGNLKNKDINLFTVPDKGNASVIVVAPSSDCDFSGYNNIVCLDKLSARLACLSKRKIFVYSEGGYPQSLNLLSADRQILASVYSRLSANEGNLIGATCSEIALKNPLGFDCAEVAFALAVFVQLSIISLDGGKIRINRGVKRDLNQSAIYTAVKDKIWTL